jgi:hypothetical protein
MKPDWFPGQFLGETWTNWLLGLILLVFLYGIAVSFNAYVRREVL